MDLLRVAMALMTVFGLLGLLYFISNRAKTKSSATPLGAHSVWPLRFRNGSLRSDSESLQVLRRISLTGSHQLHLIRASQETFLVCTHAHGCTLLWGSADDTCAAGPESAAVEGSKLYVS